MVENRILLVEDDDSLRVTQAMYLKREGFEVTAVGSVITSYSIHYTKLYDIGFIGHHSPRSDVTSAGYVGLLA